MSEFAETLDALREQGLFRSLRTVAPMDGGHVVIDGRRLVSVAGNDYLGLRRHPDIIAAAHAALEEHGLGAGASRLLAGTTPAHAALEDALAGFTGFDRALVFSSGYQANLGVMTALTGPGDVCFLDRLCHASLIDATRLSRATFRVWPHGDVDALDRLLAKHASRGQRFVVTEGVFSMDGDVAPLAEICEVVERREAWLILDDAHAFGVLGSGGRGTAEHVGVRLPARCVYVATLSKALGSQGGFVAAASDVIDLIVNRARSFLYSTGLAPVCAAGARAALKLVEQPGRRERVLAISRSLREKLKRTFPGLPEGFTPIVPIVMGDVDRTLVRASRLHEQGIFAPAIRPPTVPKGTARLRISLSADHSDEDIDRLVAVLAQEAL